MSLVEFVLARIADDEDAARDEQRENIPTDCWGPERVLAECAAKRRLVDWSAPIVNSERVPTDRPGVYNRREVRYANEDGEDVLRYLAMPHADHPDFCPDWRP